MLLVLLRLVCDVCLEHALEKAENSWNILDFLHALMSNGRANKRVFNLFYASHSSACFTAVFFGKECIPAYFPVTPFSIALPFSFPPPALQQGTDERSKVSPVEEAAFCRSHASASLHTHTHRICPHPMGGERDSAGSHYRCRPSAHTNICARAAADGSLPE